MQLFFAMREAAPRPSEGISLGRWFTRDAAFCHAKKEKQPFIVREVAATMLRRNLKLSRGARALYLTMVSLADAATGELRLPGGHWLDSRYIAREAEMGRDKFRQHRKELLEAGLIHDSRPRVSQRIKGRWFCVLTESRYSVDLKVARNGPNLLKPDFPTVEESGPLTSHKDTFGPTAVRSFGSVGESEKGGNIGRHQGTSKPDDDLRVSLPESVRPNHFEKLQDQAKQILLAEGEDAEFVEEAIRFVDERSGAHGTVPATAQYYVTAFATLKHNSGETAALWEIVHRKRELRAKYMAGFTGELSPESEESRQEFNREKVQRGGA